MPTEHDGPAIPSDGKQGYWPMSMRARAVEGGTVVEVITATYPPGAVIRRDLAMK